MKVVAAVTGLITSEIAALYALRYAKLHDYPLVLLHVQNTPTPGPEVESSMAVVEEAGRGLGVKSERLFLTGVWGLGSDQANCLNLYNICSKRQPF